MKQFVPKAHVLLCFFVSRPFRETGFREGADDRRGHVAGSCLPAHAGVPGRRRVSSWASTQVVLLVSLFNANLKRGPQKKQSKTATQDSHMKRGTLPSPMKMKQQNKTHTHTHTHTRTHTHTGPMILSKLNHFMGKWNSVSEPPPQDATFRGVFFCFCRNCPPPPPG